MEDGADTGETKQEPKEVWRLFEEYIRYQYLQRLDPDRSQDATRYLDQLTSKLASTLLECLPQERGTIIALWDPLVQTVMKKRVLVPLVPKSRASRVHDGLVFHARVLENTLLKVANQVAKVDKP